MTLRRGEEGGLRTFIQTAIVGDKGWRPPLVGEDWHAVWEATHKGIAGEEWKKLYFKYVEIGKAVNLRQPSTSRKAKNLWKAREAKENGEE